MAQLVKLSVPSPTKSDAVLHTTAMSSARTMLNDRTEPYRHSDVELLQYLNEFYLELIRLRPDLAQDMLSVAGWPPSYSSMQEVSGTQIQTESQFFPAIKNYIAGRAFMRDSEFENTGRAQQLIMASKHILVGAA